MLIAVGFQIHFHWNGNVNRCFFFFYYDYYYYYSGCWHDSKGKAPCHHHHHHHHPPPAAAAAAGGAEQPLGSYPETGQSEMMMMMMGCKNPATPQTASRRVQRRQTPADSPRKATLAPDRQTRRAAALDSRGLNFQQVPGKKAAGTRRCR